MSKHVFRSSVVFFTLFSFAFSVSAQDLLIPAGTPVYAEMDEEVISKKRKLSVGQIVRAHVWRNVVVDGQEIINPVGSVICNTPATLTDSHSAV